MAGTYATTAQIAARLPGRSIGATTKPSSTQVDEWIEEAEAEITGEILAAGFSMPAAASTGGKIIRSKVVSYVAGRCERAYASGTTLETDTVGEDLITEYRDFLLLIRQDPSRVATMLGLTSSSSSSDTNSLRSYVTHNGDSLSTADGDFEPEITRKGRIF